MRKKKSSSTMIKKGTKIILDTGEKAIYIGPSFPGVEIIMDGQRHKSCIIGTDFKILKE